MSEAPFVVVFDLDGTLAATADDVLVAVNRVLATQGLPPFGRQKAFELVSLGNGARALIEASFRKYGRVLSVEELDAHVASYLDLYLDAVCVHSTLYPDCASTLGILESLGYRLAVCTNKPQTHTQALLTQLDIRSRFAAVAGRDAYAFHKPDPRHLLRLIADAGGLPERAVMVGDTRVDVKTARAAGVPVILFSHGYAGGPLTDFQADVTIDAFADLLAAIERVRLADTLDQNNRK